MFRKDGSHDGVPLLPLQLHSGSREKKRRGLPDAKWMIMLVVEVFIYSSYSILVHMSKVGGKIPFSSSSLVLLTELLKLMISFVMYFPELSSNSYKFPHVSVMMCLPFAVPAVLYCFNNNIALHMQLQMDPTTYQVLCNLKIACTALMYRCIIRRHLSATKWIALTLLMGAGICDSYGGFHSKVQNEPQHIFITPQGLGMMTSYCMISGLAAVYTEYILKKQLTLSLHVQNMLLYIYGLILNGSTWMVQNYASEDQDSSFLKGFSVYTWLIVITQAFNGLIMSVIMKHGSNITRLFVISSAMLVSTSLAVFVLGTIINVFFVTSAVFVILAIYLYHR